MAGIARSRTSGGVGRLLLPAGGIARAEEFVTGGTGAATDADFEQGAALGAVVGLDERAAAIGGVLAADAAAGVGLELESLRRDRFAADLADDDLLPLVAVGLVGIDRHGKRTPLAAIARKAVAVRCKDLADALLGGSGGAAEMAERAQPPNDLGFAAKRSPPAVLAL